MLGPSLWIVCISLLYMLSEIITVAWISTQKCWEIVHQRCRKSLFPPSFHDLMICWCFTSILPGPSKQNNVVPPPSSKWCIRRPYELSLKHKMSHGQQWPFIYQTMWGVWKWTLYSKTHVSHVNMLPQGSCLVKSFRDRSILKPWFDMFQKLSCLWFVGMVPFLHCLCRLLFINQTLWPVPTPSLACTVKENGSMLQEHYMDCHAPDLMATAWTWRATSCR